MNRIFINLDHVISTIDRNIFGGFAEHLGRCIYEGMYEPGSPLADEHGFRTDVLDALRRMNMPVIRYPGGNFASGYRWMDGVGPRENRPARKELAWDAIEPNTFGTNEFVDYCRALNTEPLLVANCGDGDMREARDWVEYCNGTQDTALVKLRKQHGYETPHAVKYWGLGNEVDGWWQIGAKTPQEYARTATEFGKVMKLVDPSIKLIANGVSHWDARDWVERCQLLLEQAAKQIDYLALHWYYDNKGLDFAQFMTMAETIDERLTAYTGLVRAMLLERAIKKPIYLAVDEWNVWHFDGDLRAQTYTLEDALVVALHLNAFIRHSSIVKMANIAQIVNVLAPITTRPDGLFLQPTFFPFELFSNLAGSTALNVHWDGDTFSAGERTGLRALDVTATLDADRKQLVVFVVNRSEQGALETTLDLARGEFAGDAQIHTINGRDIKAINSFDAPDEVKTRRTSLVAHGSSLRYTFEPHSITALVCPVR